MFKLLSFFTFVHSVKPLILHAVNISVIPKICGEFDICFSMALAEHHEPYVKNQSGHVPNAEKFNKIAFVTPMNNLLKV